MAKPPTFGQKPDLTPELANLPKSAWEPIQDLTHLQNFDGVIEAGNTSNQAVQTAAQFLFPQQVQAYRDWALHNPTVDPRTWAPLAEGGIIPNSAAGKSISNGAIASQVDSSVHDVAIGSNQSITPTGGAWSSQNSPFPTPPGGGLGIATPGTPTATEGTASTPLLDLMNGVGNTAAEVASGIGSGMTTGIRGAQYALASGWDAMQGTARSAAGMSQKQMEVASKYGLSQEEANIAFPVTPALQSIAGKDLNKQPSNPAEQNQQGGILGFIEGAISGSTHKGASQMGGNDTNPANIPADRMAVIKQAQADYAATAPSAADLGSQIAEQTPLGQIAKNPSLLTNDSGFLAANPKVYEATDAASLKAYDPRTTDEILQGVQPYGWTPGRGVAHVVADPGTSAFNLLSGAIDFSTNLAFDPANKIPLNAPKKILHGASDLIDMMAGGGTNLGAVRRATKISDHNVAVQTTGLPVAEVTDAEKAAVEAYTKNGHKPVNTGLRSDTSTVKEPTAGMSKVAKARTEALDTAATKHELPQDTVLYRKVNVDVPTAKGRVITNKGFASTTTAEQASRTGTILRIHAPAGAAGIDVNRALDAAATDTGEFILPRGSKFKVTGTEGNVVDVVLKNPKKAEALANPTGGMAAARATAAGAKVADALDANGKIAYRTSDEALHLPDGTNVDPSTGLVHGPNAWIVMGENAWNFLNSGRGKALVTDLVNEKSASRIMARSNFKIDHQLADVLAKADTPEEVRAAIGTRLGFDLNDPSSLHNFGARTPAVFKNVALRDNGVLNMLRKAPHARPFDLEDTDNTITQVSRFARGARMKWDQIQPHLDRIIAAKGDGVKSYNAIYGNDILQADGTTKYVPGLLDAVADHMSNTLGIDQTMAKRVTTAFKSALDEDMRNFVNSGILNAMGTSNGTVGSALLDSELLTRAAVLPDYRTVRELTGAIGRLLHNSPKLEETNVQVTKLINSATSAWKSAVLVRPAYVFREIGEMAVAGSLAGYEGALTSPGTFVGMLLSTIAQKEAATSFGRLSKALTLGETPARHFAALDQKAARGGISTKASVVARKSVYRGAAAPAALANYLHLIEGMRILFPSMDPKWARTNGEGLFDNLNHYMKTGESADLEKMYYGFSAVSGNFNIDERGMGRQMAKLFGTASQKDIHRVDYANGLVGKLATLGADGDMRNLANSGMDFRKAVEAFQQSGRKDRKILAGAKNFVGRSDEEYMQGLNDVLQKLTGGDQKLLDAVASGTFDGMGLTKHNEALTSHIKGLLDDPKMAQSLPATVKYLKPQYANGSKVRDLVSQFFEFTGEGSDLMQRGQLFRHAYAREVERLTPAMDPAEHAAMVEGLKKYGDTELLARATNRAPSGTLHRYEVDHLAMKHARDEQARIFYDAHERQNYAVALRTLMPFAQATFNTIRRWGQFSLSNPQLMYRTLKPLNYAMQPGSASMYGALGALYGTAASTALYDPSSYGYSTPDNRHNSADGFAYTDAYGDRKFTYPLIGALGQWAGIPQAAMNESSVSGLNVAGTSINPGFGPGVTFAASIFGQDLINRDDAAGSVARFLFPYSLPTGSFSDKVAFSAAPSWLAKVLKSSDDSGSVANLAIKVQPVLMQNGHYDLTSVADQNRLATDSAELAKRLYLWNAIIGTLTPSTINTKTLVADAPAGKPVGPVTPVGGYTPTDGGAIIDQILKADPHDSQKAVQRFVIQDKMRQEWDKYTAGTGSVQAYRDGVLNFVHDHGVTALFSVIPSTQGAGGNSPTQATNDVWHFHTNEPDTYSKYQNVIGLFFAGGSALIPGDTSPTGYASPMYAVQKASGERTQMTPSDHIKAAMNEYGWLLYNPKKAEIETNAGLDAGQKSAANDQLTSDIMEITDGAWTPQGADPGKTDRLLQQLHTAVQDPTIQTLNSAPYLKDYMDYRDQIFEEMRHAGMTTSLSSQASQPYAIKLIDRAKELIRADPTGAFNNAWNRLLIKEYGG